MTGDILKNKTHFIRQMYTTSLLVSVFVIMWLFFRKFIVVSLCRPLVHPVSPQQPHPPSQPPPPVVIDVYYETLCPYSIEFIRNQLQPTFNLLNPSGIIRVRLYPYGHVEETFGDDGQISFNCQHGVLECRLNVVETCVEYLYNEIGPDNL